VLLALIPGATSALLYTFMGMFLPAHMLLAAALIAAFAGILTGRRTNSRASAAVARRSGPRE
jgi:uncharacterized membrane protein YfcA